MSRAILSLSVLLAAAFGASAHPVPKDNHDRTLVIRLTPSAVIVEYRLELDETRAALDMPKSELAKVASVAEFRPAFRRYFAPVLADNLVAKLDGAPLTFSCAEQRHFYTDHLRCDYRFEAPCQLESGREHAFTFREANFFEQSDSASKLLVSVVGEGGVVLKDVTVADAALQAKPGDQRGPKEEEKLRCAAATLVLTPKLVLAEYRGGLPPELDDRLGPESGQIVADAKPRPTVSTQEETGVRRGPEMGQVVATSKTGPEPLD